MVLGFGCNEDTSVSGQIFSTYLDYRIFHENLNTKYYTGNHLYPISFSMNEKG